MDALTNPGVEIGIDTGGTFTDIVCMRDGRPVGTAKVPSTPSDPSLAILEGLSTIWTGNGEFRLKPSHALRMARRLPRMR